MIKALVCIFAITCTTVMLILSMALTKDFTDPITKEKHVDKEGKIMGYIGFAICFIILYGLYKYIFKS